ncbi:MAG: nitroreductase family protein [Thermotaleaceae bacterium]
MNSHGKGESMDIICVLENRKSVRNYKKKVLPENLLEKIIHLATVSRPLYQDIQIKFIPILDGAKASKKLSGFAGYFGKTIEAPHYIAVITDKKEGYLENLGYCMEQLMLEAYKEELGTCWIEVLHYESKLKEAFGVFEPDKIMLALTPIGYPKETAIDKLTGRFLEEKSVRKSVDEIVFFQKWGKQTEGRDLSKYLEILDIARWAPSWGNQQPWQFIIDENKVVLAVMKEKNNAINRNRIDGGIIMLYFEWIARQKNIFGTWSKAEKRMEEYYRIPEKFELLSVFKENSVYR